MSWGLNPPTTPTILTLTESARSTFIVHPHEVFLESINLSFAADDPIIVYNKRAVCGVIMTG